MADLPSEEELAKLGKYKIVAYAARSAMRSYAFWLGGDKETFAIRKATQTSAETAAGKVTHADYVDDLADAILAGKSTVAYFHAAARVATIAAKASVAYPNAVAKFACEAAIVAGNAAHAFALAVSKGNSFGDAYDAQLAANAAAISDFEKLKTLPDGPLNCGPSGPLGPVWPDWKPPGWDESKLDFVYEDGNLEPGIYKKSGLRFNPVFVQRNFPPLEIAIDPGGAKSEKLTKLLITLDALYKHHGGSGLKIAKQRDFVLDRGEC